jgi:hypothetical protein
MADVGKITREIEVSPIETPVVEPAITPAETPAPERELEPA